MHLFHPGRVYDVYADFNTLTLEITLEALFGFTLEPAGPLRSPDFGLQPSMRVSSNDQAKQIVQAVEKAFEFFTKRAGSALVGCGPTLIKYVYTLQAKPFFVD